jgi:hypothetical protein
MQRELTTEISTWACHCTGLPSFVYYVGDPDSQLIKIGTSTGINTRLSAIRKRRPGALLLAAEPGSYSAESLRHREFAEIRKPLATGEREWFRKEPLLMRHVNEVRAKYGIPESVRSSWVAGVKA